MIQAGANGETRGISVNMFGGRGRRCGGQGAEVIASLSWLKEKVLVDDILAVEVGEAKELSYYLFLELRSPLA